MWSGQCDDVFQAHAREFSTTLPGTNQVALEITHLPPLPQKFDILSDPKLPDIFRVALAKSLQDDLFAHVR